MDHRKAQEVFRAQMAVECRQAAGVQARRMYRIDEQAYCAAEALSSYVTHGSVSADWETWRPLLPDEADFAAFFKALLAHLHQRGVTVAPEHLLTGEDKGRPGARVAYAKNRYTDRAFSCFAPDLDTPTVLYKESFSEACAAVQAGEADLCILPWRDGSRAPLYTFFRMMEQHELVLRAVCCMAEGEGDDIFYALCGKGILIPDGAVWVDFFLPARSDTAFGKLLAFADEMKFSVAFAEARPDRYTQCAAWRVTLALPTQAALCALLLYFRLYDTDAELLGVYMPPGSYGL